MTFFDSSGYCLASTNSRVFSQNKKNYYKFADEKINIEKIYENLKQFGNVPKYFSLQDFISCEKKLVSSIKNDSNFNNILFGPSIPFVYQNDSIDLDLGLMLENSLLPCLKNSFESMFPDSHFKAILQANSKLKSTISLSQHSRYEIFIKSLKRGTFGLFFPLAFKEFDVESQRSIISNLPSSKEFNICLSGGIDVCSALIGMPNLLINKHSYSPILCLSAYQHIDERLILLIKSYGPHLEFWCMSQMLTPNTKQVSEQWSAGLTIFSEIN